MRRNPSRYEYALLTLALASCSRVVADTCLPPGIDYGSATAAYNSQKYAEASRQFELISLAEYRCENTKLADPGALEAIAKDMLTAAEAAHFAKQSARAHALALNGLSMVESFEKIAVHDHTILFILAGDEVEAKSDLRGVWTIGVRQ